MGLKGKFVRRDGTLAIFGSQKKPEWKPIDISSRVDPSSLIPGEYYDLTLEGQSLVEARRLEPRGSSSTYTPGKEGGGYAAPAPSRPDVMPIASLCASATGFAKSCIEAGMPAAEAAQAGIRWARIWGEVPKPKESHSPPHSPQQDLSDDIPF